MKDEITLNALEVPLEGLVYLGCLISIGALALFLSVQSIMKRNTGEAVWLAVLLSSISLWTFMQAVSLIVTDHGYKLFFHNLMFIGICLVPVSIFFFILEHYTLMRHLRIPIRISLFVVPLITLSLVATNSHHHLFYRSVRFLELGNYTRVSGTFTIGFWIHSMYSYLLILSAVLVILHHLQSESAGYRHQSMVLVTGILAALLINLLTISGMIPSMPDLTPFTFVIVAIVFCQSIFHPRVFEIGPITKDLLYDTIFDGLMIVNANGAIIEHNKAFLKLFRLTAQQVEGKHAVELFSALGYSGDAIINATRSPFCLLTGSNDAMNSWQITAFPLKGYNNDSVSTLYLFRDVTDIDRRITEAGRALKTAVNARESITRNLSDMSHEIRTPLMGILGAAHQLQSDACDEEQSGDAREILTGAEELLETVTRILDFSKLEAGKMNAQIEAFPLDTYLNALKERTHPEIVWTASESLGDIRYLKGDLHHLMQILQLVHSYLKDSGTGLLYMTIGYEDGHLTQLLDFKIPDHDARELLERWGHLGDYLTKPWKPDPMKLLLIQKLCAFMGAPITLERLDFQWILRLKVPMENIPEDRIVLTPSPDESEKIYNLLFAEDSVINQAVIKRMLKSLPWKITFASNGFEALELAQIEVYDGIFTDVHMPGLGGIELSYSLKETINCSTPVFALTSDTDAELQKAVEASPIRALLVKPCPKEKLIQLLNENPRIYKMDA